MINVINLIPINEKNNDVSKILSYLIKNNQDYLLVMNKDISLNYYNKKPVSEEMNSYFMFENFSSYLFFFDNVFPINVIFHITWSFV